MNLEVNLSPSAPLPPPLPTKTNKQTYLTYTKQELHIRFMYEAVRQCKVQQLVQ